MLSAKSLGNILLIVVPIVICLSVSELMLRILMYEELSLGADERELLYRYDETKGWAPKQSSKGTYFGSRSVTINHNSHGFRDPEPVFEKANRVMFLGDSFVWGYDVEEGERFSDQLRSSLIDWDVYNLGVSGYGSDQELILLKEQFDTYQPDLVFLVYCTSNDKLDNSQNIRYGSYYKPYYELIGDRIELKGNPAPKGVRYFSSESVLKKSFLVRLILKSYFASYHPQIQQKADPTFMILKEMDRYVRSKGSRLVIGFQKKYPLMENFLEKEGVEFINLENEHVYRLAGQHWNPEGHTYVANRIEEYLLNDLLFLSEK